MGRGFDSQPRHLEIGDIWIDVSVRESHEVSAEVSTHPVEVGSNIADHIRPEPRTITIDGLVTNHPLELPMSHVGSAKLERASLELQVATSPLPRVDPSSGTILGEPSVGAFGLIPGVDQGVALLGAIKVEVRSKVELSADEYHVNQNARTSIAANVVRFTEPFDRVGAVHEALQRIFDNSELVTVVTGLAIYSSVALTSLSMERNAEVGPDVLKFTANGSVLRFVKSAHAQLPDPVNPRGKPAQSQGKQATTVVDPASLSPATKATLIKKFKDNPEGFIGGILDLFGMGAK